MGSKGDISKTKTKTKAKEISDGKISKSSHLYLQEKKLDSIPELPFSKDVSVLYLFDNNIRRMENLDAFPNLTSLYLQRNKIEAMGNLNGHRSIRKLYVGRNRIAVVEGLEGAACLEELHAEKQRLLDKVPLCIDPRTVLAVSRNLRVLNLSHNNIVSIAMLKPLANLEVLNASFNDIDSVEDICDAVGEMAFLSEATFAGNPCTKRHRYRESIVAKSFRLAMLDGKRISEVTRSFMLGFERGKKVNEGRAAVGKNFDLGGAVVPEVAKNYPLSLRKAVSISMLKSDNEGKAKKSKQLDLSLSFEEGEEKHLPWRALPKKRPGVRVKSRKSGKRNVEGKGVFVSAMSLSGK